MFLPKRRVIISQIAFQKISNCIFETGNQYEVGGVLLGQRQLRTYFLTDATTPDNQRQKSNHSFELDGAQEMRKIDQLYGAYRNKPMVIGVWHSHVGGVEIFSQQDRISNKRFANVAGGIISAIAIPASSAQLKHLIFYYISQKGNEFPCISQVDNNSRYAYRLWVDSLK